VHTCAHVVAYRGGFAAGPHMCNCRPNDPVMCVVCCAVSAAVL
jgi:hypothetical protein